MAEMTGIIKSAEIEESLPPQYGSFAKTEEPVMSGRIRSSITGASVEAPDFYGKTQTYEFRVNLCHGGSGGAIGNEVDPTVPDYVKDISQKNISTWNGKLDSSSRITNTELEDILR